VGGRSGADGIVVREVSRAIEQDISVNAEVEDSRRGTRGQLVGGTVEVQLAENFLFLRKLWLP
jgi:hypothetical protein